VVDDSFNQSVHSSIVDVLDPIQTIKQTVNPTALELSKGTKRLRDRQANISVFNIKSSGNMLPSTGLHERVRNANTSCDFAKGVNLKRSQISLAAALGEDFQKDRIRNGIGRSMQNL
jgi:hypothetical protein